jgi:23S rRNA (pseudouridine1915-N3)-methyltransferase
VKLTLLVVGRVRGPLHEAVAEYEARAGRYWKIDVVEVEAGSKGAGGDPQHVQAAEEGRLLPRVPTGTQLVALTRGGEPMDSIALATYLQGLALHGSPGATFVIGGAFGLGAGVLERARRRLTLSALTLPHELARLILAEQLYRAGTILRGEPYHKGPSL